MSDIGPGSFADMASTAIARAKAEENHRLECELDRCDRCSKAPCATCRKPFVVEFSQTIKPRPRQCPSCATMAAETERLRPARSSIPDRFDWASFEAPELRARCGSINVDRAQRAIAEHRKRVVLLGAPGSGKTSLAVAMLRSLIDGPRSVCDTASCRFVSAYALNKARGQHPLGQGEAPLVASALAADVLVLDDLGSEIDRFGTAVSEVLYERHNDERATWVTTWMTPQQAAERYNGGIARRLFEDAVVIRLGKSAP